jgi:hypothetical protein
VSPRYNSAKASFMPGCIYWNTYTHTPLPGGGYQPMSFGGENIKIGMRKKGKCKRKRRKDKR